MTAPPSPSRSWTVKERWFSPSEASHGVVYERSTSNRGVIGIVGSVIKKPVNGYYSKNWREEFLHVYAHTEDTWKRFLSCYGIYIPARSVSQGCHRRCTNYLKKLIAMQTPTPKPEMSRLELTIWWIVVIMISLFGLTVVHELGNMHNYGH